jgi:hypothetical protein
MPCLILDQGWLTRVLSRFKSMLFSGLLQAGVRYIQARELHPWRVSCEPEDLEGLRETRKHAKGDEWGGGQPNGSCLCRRVRVSSVRLRFRRRSAMLKVHTLLCTMFNNGCELLGHW